MDGLMPDEKDFKVESPKGRFSKVPEALWVSKVSPFAKLVYARLDWHAWYGNKQIKPGRKSISKFCGISEKTVSKAFRELEQNGFLRIKRRMNQVSIYYLDPEGKGEFPLKSGKAPQALPQNKGKNDIPPVFPLNPISQERPHRPSNKKDLSINALTEKEAKANLIEDLYRTLDKPSLPDRVRAEIKAKLRELEN
jgi:DNA-binding Lrp family transcriptional regulator